MKPTEEKKILKSMVILVDTREQPTKLALERWEGFGYPYERVALPAGDYSAKIKIDGKEISLEKKIVIERKMSIDEICGNFGTNRQRFIREFEKIKANGTRCYLLIENATWEKIYNHKYRSRMLPGSLVASLTAWMARYDCKVIFCKNSTSAKMIRDILYREVKEMLKNERL